MAKELPNRILEIEKVSANILANGRNHPMMSLGRLCIQIK
jgi:hypothetical protein